MASEVLSADAAPSLSLYFAVTNSSLAYLDFADNVFKALSHNAISAATAGSAGSGSFTVSGNITASLTVGRSVRVRGSSGGANDGVYTIRSGSAFAGGNTTVNVTQAVASSTGTGTLDLNATPGLSATETVNGGGLGISTYTASLNLALVNNTTTVSQYNVQGLSQAGSFMVPDADTPQTQKAGLTVQLGLKGVQNVVAKFQIGTTTTSGNQAELAAWLECNGQVVNPNTVDPNGSGGSLSTAAATLVMFGQTSGGSPTFTVTTGNFGQPTTDGRFEYTKSAPGFTGDQLYSALVTLTVNGNTFSCDSPFQVFP
jgi:hypothetical protein